MPTRAMSVVVLDSSVRFEVLRDGKSVRSLVLVGPTIRVGRVGAFGLHLLDEGVEALHAIISSPSQDNVMLSPVGEAKVTVNGMPIVETAPLKSQDFITFGKAEVVILLGEDRALSNPI